MQTPWRSLTLSAILVLIVSGCVAVNGPAQNGSCLPDSIPSQHTLFGRPEGAPASNELVVRELYELSSNHATKFADWVAYFLDGSTFGRSRDVNWDNDECIPAAERLEHDGASGDDMIGAAAKHGYERGHMAANATFAGSDLWAQINLYSNMIPQHETLNGGVWADLEAAVRDFVNAGNEVYVLTGTLYQEAMPILPNADEAHIVPSDVWKIVATGAPGEPENLKATAFLFDQHGCVVELQCDFPDDFEDAIVPIDRIENVSAADGVSTDLDVFPDLPDEVEANLESAAGAWPPGNSSADNEATNVQITKVLADAEGQEPANEWFEVCNQATDPVDISGWTVTDEEGIYRFPEGTKLEPVATVGSCIRVSGTEYNPSGDDSELALANSGEALILHDERGNEVYRCSYDEADEGEPIVCVN